MTERVITLKKYNQDRIVDKIRFHREVLETLDRIVQLGEYRSRSHAVRELVKAEWLRVKRREKMLQKKLAAVAAPDPEPTP